MDAVADVAGAGERDRVRIVGAAFDARKFSHGFHFPTPRFTRFAAASRARSMA